MFFALEEENKHIIFLCKAITSIANMKRIYALLALMLQITDHSDMLTFNLKQIDKQINYGGK